MRSFPQGVITSYSIHYTKLYDPTLAITSKAKAMKAEGIDVVGFGAGEPDFDTPEHIKAVAKKALDNGYTKYTPVPGTPELKDAVIAKFRRDNGLEYKRENIIV